MSAIAPSASAHGALSRARLPLGSFPVAVRPRATRRPQPPASRLAAAALSAPRIASCVPRDLSKRMYDFVSSNTFFVCTLLTSYHTYVKSSIVDTFGGRENG